ncbi:FtsK/SpoIIIE domain-containing protein [Streptantibioticus ferralitis]|uniref:FtsK/SpoIIIE domain-containing protein n=1 Tax=Streptantibioticus ferralitis TaxID=236510 RepID=A0ABT5Z3L0_9ACTN|nr:FtsK/SpoIIIE domain-containing protein [Streptantibioticus ferralitis]MDF2258417.1 FtsK/SpoIIIE domain-containing protein [Streptantibioticus ferralitis]
MRVSVTVVQQGVEPQDVLLNVEEDASVAEVAKALSPPTTDSAVVTALPGVPYDPRFAGRADAPVLWADGRRCDPDARVSDVLRDGMRISVDDAIGPYLRAGEPSGHYELKVVGGPGAGRVARLAVGVTTVGSADRCTITVPDTRLPHEALCVSIAADGQVKLARRGMSVPVLLDNEPVEGEREWPRGALVKCGASLFVLDAPAEPDAHLMPMGEGGLAYNRPPRLNSLPQRSRLVVPRAPGKAERTPFRLIAMIAPAVFGLLMYLTSKQLYSLLFCAMTPALMIGEWFSHNREGKKKHRTSLKQYKEEKDKYDSELVRLTRVDQQARRTAHPDAASLLLFATGPRRRLWERRITDPDALLLRIGVADLPADIELVPAPGTGSDEPPPEVPAVHDVPVLLPFTKLGVVGLAGARPQALVTARWLAAQAVVLHSPRDLSVVVLSSVRDSSGVWDWARWLPHASPQQGQDCVALVGSDSETIGRRVNELLGELNRRKDASSQMAGPARLRPDPYILVVLDGARLLRRAPGVPQLLQEGPLHGIFALCIDEDERLLPEECQAAICWPPGATDRLHLRGAGLEALGDVLADQVSGPWCDLLARSLAPIRDVSRDDADSALPSAARLLTLLGMPDPTGTDIERLWRAGGATTRAPIGVGADGTFFLDVHGDGPHALVAGTTGAGKSELLQTIITSLAAHNRPDALNYVLIDYKGGSAFQDCARLPHTVGMVSDLDAHLTERALASLAAELRRREEILFEARAKDIEDYADTRRLRPELEPMPRLVLIIDEFASLVAELPDFVEGLVDIARRGRSLGVHLVLATQRPAGVVSADIRANTNLRIALRVTDAGESSDVIDAPDAGAISKSTPGRMYVRSGAQALVAVQSARIGGRRPGQSSKPTASVVPLPWPSVGRSLPRTADDGDDGTMQTDLAVLVDAIRAGSQQMGFGKPRSPWLPPLPKQITVAELYESKEPAHGDVPAAIFGVVDVPARQARAPLSLDLVDGEHLLIIGGPRSGRSTALRTIAASLAMTASPSDIHIYGVDCGANVLLPLTRLPHCGGIVTRDETERLVRLLGRLQGEVTRRQQLLADLGVSSVAEQRASEKGEDRLPWMVLLLDGWEGYVSTFENYDYGRLLDAMTRLFREGPAVGLRVVMTADRSGMTGSMTSSFGDRLILRLTDPNDYGIAGINQRAIPKDMPQGRALRLTDDGVQECQIALLDPDPAGKAQVSTVQQIAKEARDLYPRPSRRLRPMRVDALPPRATASEALALDPEFQRPSNLWALVGVGGDELAPHGVDLSESGPGFVIAGPPKSGRSTTLIAMTRSLTCGGLPVILITPKRSPLKELEGEPAVLGVLSSEATQQDLNDLIAKAHGGRYAVVVDDAELLYDTPLDSALEEVIRAGLDGDHAVIAAGAAEALSTQYRGFVVEARRSRNGFLLAPTPDAGEQLFGVRLARTASAGSAGRGVLISAGAAMPLQAVVDRW